MHVSFSFKKRVHLISIQQYTSGVGGRLGVTTRNT